MARYFSCLEETYSKQWYDFTNGCTKMTVKDLIELGWDTEVPVSSVNGLAVQTVAEMKYYKLLKHGKEDRSCYLLVYEPIKDSGSYSFVAILPGLPMAELTKKLNAWFSA